MGLMIQKLGACEQHPTSKGFREDGLTVGVSPVGAQAESSGAPPLRFTFKTPPIPRNTGKQLRPEEVPSRKSPPHREVGPDDDSSNGTQNENIEPNGEGGSQGGEPVEAPLVQLTRVIGACGIAIFVGGRKRVKC